MSTSPEAFLALRSHFAKSFATLCICHYILGIGDRHLSNFLLSLDSGRMIGIDFGHAFGSATLVSSNFRLISQKSETFALFSSSPPLLN